MRGDGTQSYVPGVLDEGETWGNCNAGIWKTAARLVKLLQENRLRKMGRLHKEIRNTALSRRQKHKVKKI